MARENRNITTGNIRLFEYNDITWDVDAESEVSFIKEGFKMEFKVCQNTSRKKISKERTLGQIKGIKIVLTVGEYQELAKLKDSGKDYSCTVKTADGAVITCSGSIQSDELEWSGKESSVEIDIITTKLSMFQEDL